MDLGGFLYGFTIIAIGQVSKHRREILQDPAIFVLFLTTFHFRDWEIGNIEMIFCELVQKDFHFLYHGLDFNIRHDNV